MLLTILASALIGAPAPWPHAALPCSPPDAIFSPTAAPNTFASLDLALTQALASPGVDGTATVHVPPGNYVLRYADRAAWSVNARGAHVELCAPGGIASFAMNDGSYRFAIASLGSARLVNLSFDSAWPGVFSSRDAIEILNTRIRNATNECVSWGSSPGGGPDDEDPVQFSYALIYRSALIDCGLGDGDGHAMYLSRRGCSAYIIESELHSQTTLEAWRSLCRFNVWASNDLSNTGTGPERPGQGGVVDSPSCGTNVFVRNRIVTEGNNAAIALRGRRGITGCDMPNQREEADTGIAGTPPFLVRAEAFWSSVRAKPFPLTSIDPSALLSNPRLFPVILQDNDIRSVDNSTTAAILLYSTYAQDKVAATSEYLRLPANWTERSWALLIGAGPVNFRRVWLPTRNMAIAPETLPDVKEYVRTVLDPTELPKYVQVAAPPAEWMPDTNDPRTLCEYFRARSDWTDEPGQGFPSCDRVPRISTCIGRP